MDKSALFAVDATPRRSTLSLGTPLDSQLGTFLERHGASTDGLVATVAQGIREGTIVLVSVSEGVSAQHIARIYDIRSGIAKSEGRPEVAGRFAALSTKCGQSHDPACAIWLFAGAGKDYGLFEMMPSHEIVGCLEFPGGTIDVTANDA
jgi:hypothetical protein